MSNSSSQKNSVKSIPKKKSHLSPPKYSKDEEFPPFHEPGVFSSRF
jgi:hypothetical protein